MLEFHAFRSEFEHLVQSLNINWEVLGFIGPDDKVYPIGTDTKVISTIFESISAPLISAIAERCGYEVEGAPQTIYPDFTLSPKGARSGRIAVDIKTTYKDVQARGRIKPFRYTLGSYTSFLRDPNATKNILYPYAEYSDHWVIGFLYRRRPGVSAKVYHRKDIGQLQCPYTNVEYFVQEKYKIVGESPGSGNTTNIGSFVTSDIQDYRDGNGPFTEHGKELCDLYWRHYHPKLASRQYTNVTSFIKWQRGQQPPLFVSPDVPPPPAQ